MYVHVCVCVCMHVYMHVCVCKVKRKGSQRVFLALLNGVIMYVMHIDCGKINCAPYVYGYIAMWKWVLPSPSK